MRIIDVDQRSPEWFSVRLGRLTGSCVAEAFAKTKSGAESAGRRNVRVRLTLERLTSQSQEIGWHSLDMDRGIELEAEACAAYESETGILVQSVGFIAHDELMAGCSPDGLTLAGGIEVKCPKAATHLDYLRGGLPNEYFLQSVHGLWLTGRDWWDFISYHPAFPEPLRLKISRIHAKDVDLKAHELNVRLFLDEVAKEVESVNALMAVPA